MADDDLSVPGPGVKTTVYAVSLDAIDEPRIAARIEMDETKMAELIEDMKARGIDDPIKLRRQGERFEIIAGHRRWYAAKQLGWSAIPALIRDCSDAEMLAERLHENIDREDLNAAEEAQFMAEVMKEYSLDLPGLCKTFGKSESYINARFALYWGDRDIFEAVLKRQIRLGVAHELNKITDAHYRNYYLQAAIREDPTQKTVQGWVREWRTFAPSTPVIEMPAAEPPEPAEAPAPFFGCVFCGGHLDRWNLVNVLVHKHEIAQILVNLGHSPEEVRNVLLASGFTEAEISTYVHRQRARPEVEGDGTTG